MADENNLPWPSRVDLAAIVGSANNLSPGQSPYTLPASKDQVRRSGLPVRIQDGRHRASMNLRKFFARDGNVQGLIRRTKRPRKGLVDNFRI